MTTMPHIDLLELPYFEGMSLDKLLTLVDHMQPKTYDPGQFISAEGVASNAMLIIATSGELLVTKTGLDGKKRNLAELKAPTLLGEIEMFCGIPAVASIKAVTSVAAFTLDKKTFAKLCEEHHPAMMQFIFNVAKVGCHRLAVADEMLATVLTNEDLCTLRQDVFNRRQKEDQWSSTTGSFPRPQLRRHDD